MAVVFLQLTLKCSCGNPITVPERVIVSEAARIFQARRKHRRGGHAPGLHSCRWCGIAVAGLRQLQQHERECDKSLAAELGAAELEL
jgi:hypothetical protein